jgi:hypothetical protein
MPEFPWFSKLTLTPPAFSRTPMKLVTDMVLALEKFSKIFMGFMCKKRDEKKLHKRLHYRLNFDLDKNFITA